MKDKNIIKMNSEIYFDDASTSIDSVVRKSNNKKVVAKKVTVKKTKKKVSKKSSNSLSKKKSKKKIRNRNYEYGYDSISAPRNKKYEPETVSEELLKITNTKSMDQLKRPRRIAFMIGFYVLLFMAAIVFCMIWFSKANKSKSEYDFDYDFEYLEANSDDYFSTYYDDTSDEIIEGTTEEESTPEIETTKKVAKTNKKIVETAKVVEETDKKAVETTESSQKNTKETLKAVREATTKATKKKETAVVEKESMNMINNTKDKDSVYDYSKEIYSKATYYQYTLMELNNIKAKLATLYAGVKDKIFGDISYDIKGKNGIIYINFKNLDDFIKEKNDNMASEYDRLIPVDRLSGEVMFSFPSAVDKGIYYDIPANNGQRSIIIKVLKGAKVGFSKDYVLTGALEILDMECGTKLNTYFNIEDIVGKNPVYKGIMPDSGFNLDEALKTKHFNYVIYDKKGYVTDLMCLS